MHQHDSLLNLAQLKAELLAQHTDLRLTQDEAHDLSFASSRVSGSFALELWVHHLQSSGLSARRPAAGEDLAQLPACERLHLWVTVRDAAGAYVHHQVLCDAQGLHALLQAWREPMAPTPDGLRMAAATAPVARKSARAPTAPETPETPTPVCDASALRAWDEVLASPLLAGMAPADAEQLRADLARVDPQQLARHWPRDARGRLAAKTTALLAACGPPVTLNQRQPCLLISSAGVRDMPCWQLQLSREFRENQRLQWDATPWLWARDATPPAEPTHAAQARALIAQGRIDEACALCDVSLGASLRRLAAGLPLSRFDRVNPDWVDELHAALRQLAPWALAGGLARIQQRLAAAKRKPPQPGSWSRKLLWFSGQRSQSRLGLGVRQGAHGGPELDVIATASNAWFAAPDWQDPQR